MEEMKKSMLLVEGKSEEMVIPEICNKCGIQLDSAPQSADSIEKLKASLKIHLKSTQIYNKIWVIVDADNNAEDTWRSIRDILINSGKYNITHKTKLPPDGAVIEPRDPEDITIGVWIMPNNSDPGMLEDLMLALIPEDDTLIGIARETVERLDADRHNHPKLFKEAHKSKATVHTWLAWNHKPGESLATAVKKQLFATDVQLCRTFADWLNKMND